MIVITRPQEDATILATMLRARGYHTLIEPMLAITPLPKKDALLKTLLTQNPQAILITSKHAISALASLTIERTIPVVAVGKVTAAQAKQLGFSAKNAGGTAQKLIAYVKKHYDPQKGCLLYARGADISTDIAAVLQEHHFLVESIIVYKATTAKTLSKALREALKLGRITSILFFSARSAATYTRLMMRYKLQNAHRAITSICLSKDIAEKLKPLPWKKIRVAARPDEKNALSVLLSKS